MQKIIVTVFAVLTVACVQAQFEKDSKWLGGSLGLTNNSSKSENNVTSKNSSGSASINPAYFWQGKGKQIFKVFAGYKNTHNKSSTSNSGESQGNSDEVSLGFGVIGYKSISGKLYSVFGVNQSISHSWGKQWSVNNGITTFESKQTTLGFNANIYWGFMYQLSERVNVIVHLDNMYYINIGRSKTENTISTAPAKSENNYSNMGTSLSNLSISDIRINFMVKLGKKNKKIN